tara:strand:- start:743 stop:1462 length:720 start_codon:yes stop_codon:yes gene_type:complete
MMGRRPDFIPSEIFREYMSPTKLNKYFRVGDMQASSYVARCKNLNKPIRSRFGHLSRYRPLDVVARARGEALTIKPTMKDQLKVDVDYLKNKLTRMKLELEELEAKRTHIKHVATIDSVSRCLTNRDMLLEKELVANSELYDSACGVYFLIHKNNVVYVGQSVNVFGRIHTHAQEGHKNFDAYTYIPCNKKQLDVLESLYIHALAPKLQGRAVHGNLSAPYSFNNLIELGERAKWERAK